MTDDPSKLIEEMMQNRRVRSLNNDNEERNESQPSQEFECTPLNIIEALPFQEANTCNSVAESIPLAPMPNANDNTETTAKSNTSQLLIEANKPTMEKALINAKKRKHPEPGKAEGSENKSKPTNVYGRLKARFKKDPPTDPKARKLLDQILNEKTYSSRPGETLKKICNEPSLHQYMINFYDWLIEDYTKKLNDAIDDDDHDAIEKNLGYKNWCEDQKKLIEGLS